MRVPEGPWTVERYGDGSAPNFVIHDGPDTRVCFMATATSRDGYAKIGADARLIAAAPDLYRALHALRNAVEASGALEGREYVGLGIQVTAALRKARRADS